MDRRIGALKVLSFLEERMKTAEQWRAEGETLVIMQHYQAALVAYEEAICLAPTTADLFEKKGELLLTLHRYEEGLTAFKQASTLTPDNATYYYAIANACSYLGRLDDALAAYSKVCELRPADPRVLDNKASLLFDGERYEEAVDAYTHVIEIATSPLLVAGAYHDMGRAFYQLRMYTEACAVYEQSIVLYLRESDTPDQGSVPTLNEALVNYQEACVTMSHMFLCERDFDVPPLCYCDYGLALFELQRYDDALTAYLRAWKQDPFFIIFADIARVLHALQRNDEAHVFDQLDAESKAGLDEYMAEQNLSER